MPWRRLLKSDPWAISRPSVWELLQVVKVLLPTKSDLLSVCLSCEAPVQVCRWDVMVVFLEGVPTSG